MSAAAAFEAGPADPSTPRAIREALLPEEVDRFDAEWRAALAHAAENLDLGEVHATLEAWRRIAVSTIADPDAHRRMLGIAARIRAGEAVETVPADDIRALIAERLGR